MHVTFPLLTCFTPQCIVCNRHGKSVVQQDTDGVKLLWDRAASRSLNAVKLAGYIKLCLIDAFAV